MRRTRNNGIGFMGGTASAMGALGCRSFASISRLRRFRVFFLLASLIALAPAGRAQVTDGTQAFTEYPNRRYIPGPDAIIGINDQTPRTAAFFGATVGPYAIPGSSDTPTTPTANIAALGGSIVLSESSFGQSVQTGVFGGPDYYIGQEITPPPMADLNVAPTINPPSKAFWVDHANKLFANEAGLVSVTWALSPSGSQAVNLLISNEADPAKSIVKMYHTDTPTGGGAFAPTGAPNVDIGDIPGVVIHFNSKFPNSGMQQDNAFDRLTGSNLLRARGPTTGFVLLEYNTTATPTLPSHFIRLEIVRVVPYAPDSTISILVAEQLATGSPIPPGVTLTPRATVTHGLTGNPTYLYENSVTGTGLGDLFAVRPSPPGDSTKIEVFWMQEFTVQTGSTVQWPYEMDRYVASLPDIAQTDRYRRFVRGDSGGALGPNVSIPAALGLNPVLEGWQEPAMHATLTLGNSPAFNTTSAGWSLLRYDLGSPAGSAGNAFELVRSVVHDDSAYFDLNPVDAPIGTEIFDSFHTTDTLALRPGYIHVEEGDRYDPEIYAETGQIFGVNVGPLEVWWSEVSHGVQWPSKVARYTNVWPASPEQIVIASSMGSGAIDTQGNDAYKIYFQNNPALPGFNPNDEHATIQPFGQSVAAFPLRCDLAAGNTSEPFVLLGLRNAATQKWNYRVFSVVATDATYQFHYETLAGQILQPPYPLNAIAPNFAELTQGVSGPFFEDRKNTVWAKAAGNDGVSTETIVMRYGYPFLTGFFIPNEPHNSGDEIPWLDRLPGGVLGQPTDVTFTVSWPANPPEMRIGQTLHKPAFGLPDISSQCSVEIIYEQTADTVKVVDPTKAHLTPLAALPSGIRTENAFGEISFPDLPPHLASRLTYVPGTMKLKFKGLYIEPPLGQAYFLPNVFSDAERTIMGSIPGADSTFQAALQALQTVAQNDFEFTPGETELDRLALTSGLAQGAGFVTLALQNSTTTCSPGLPVSLEIIKVTCPLDTGEIAVIEPSCPFDEKLTLKHKGDFAGNPDGYEFQWVYQQAVGGIPPAPPMGDVLGSWLDFPGGASPFITIQGPSLFTLTDNWFTVRYRPTGSTPVVCPNASGNWSEWTEVNLAEGWIKRVLKGINPFDQRFRDLSDPARTVNTTVNMISQAGPRWEGSVALNCSNVDSFGLIEIYETVLKRGMQLSIEAPIPINNPAANDALLLVSGKLADLYMLLGNEAFADATDPTIGFPTSPDDTYVAAATALHSFENLTGSLIEEELALLRGRDNSLAPPITTPPIYNRLPWNFSGDMGEVAYVLNEGITDALGNNDGFTTEADAKIIYPQGHGDAWGHYLTAAGNYYRLIQNPNFTWVPRAEAILLGGVPVTVDFIDEQKFARSAAARARTGAQIVALTHRSRYSEDPNQQWRGYKDSNTSRQWGLAEWGSRAGQAAIFDWVTANAILPEPQPGSEPNITVIDRGSVQDLKEIASQYTVIQSEVDKADLGLNPLGLAKNVMPFDISPGDIDAGLTHFEQIYNRAVLALSNVATVFQTASNTTQQLRKQSDELSEYSQSVREQESDYRSRLIEIFGTPYTNDIGPAGTYPTGYIGADIYHFDYVEPSYLRTKFLADVNSGEVSFEQKEISIEFTDEEYSFTEGQPDLDLSVNADGTIETTQRTVTYTLSSQGLGLEKPTGWGSRRVTGRLQEARSELLQQYGTYYQALGNYNSLIDQIEDTADLMERQFNITKSQITAKRATAAVTAALDAVVIGAKLAQKGFEYAAENAKDVSEATSTALPKVTGTAFDVLGPARSAIALLYVGGVSALRTGEIVSLGVELGAEFAKEQAQTIADIELEVQSADAEVRAALLELENLVRNEETLRYELYNQIEALTQAGNAYSSALAEGERLLTDFKRFRAETASEIQQQRYKDMAYRVFKNDQIQKYRAQFDLAARYVYLAARAYDYETNLLPGDSRGPGQDFLTAIVRTRAIGFVTDQDGDRIYNPETGQSFGDAGLADAMARMFGNWNLTLKGQLGFNQPQTETNRFSLREELYRILPHADPVTTESLTGDGLWRDVLVSHRVNNILVIPEFRRYARPFTPTQATEPGIVIPFSTTVNFGANLFGRELAPGDSFYSSSNFATKVRSVGVWFEGYENASLSATPRVYLFPVGMDVMRSSTPGFEGEIRQWRILDQALPVPFPLSDQQIQTPGFIPSVDSMLGQFADLRRYSDFRAYVDGGDFDPAETLANDRVVGRSVWNTRWVLVIPGGTLLNNRNDGLDRFIDNVSDIKFFFQTYAYSGN